MKKRIVTIGGGTGNYTVLKGLKNYDNLHLSAIVSMTDDGGSTGILRDEFGILPPGDIRRCIVALSESSEMMKELFQYRFNNGRFLKGHSFGNLFLTALKEITQSDEKAIEEACKIFAIKGDVIPVTLDNCQLCAELENRHLVIGETNIDIPKHDGNIPIKRVFLKPQAQAYKRALEAIENADIIILGPGDLYGSIISNLVVRGIPEAIQKSKAKKIYVCNLMTKFGETNNFQVHHFVETIEKYLGKNVLDCVIYNDSKIELPLLEKYAQEKKFPVLFDEKTFDNFNMKFIKKDLMTVPVLIRHDSQKLGEAIFEII